MLYMDIDILRVVLLTSNIMHEFVSLICCVLLFAVTSVALSNTYWGNPQCLCPPLLTHFVMHKHGRIDNQQCLKCGVCLLSLQCMGFYNLCFSQCYLCWIRALLLDCHLYASLSTVIHVSAFQNKSCMVVTSSSSTKEITLGNMIYVHT